MGHLEFLQLLENRLRLDTDQPVNAMSTDPTKLQPLARKMGFMGASAASRLLEELNRRREDVRELFEFYFARESTALN